MSKPNYELKAHVLETDLCKKCGQISRLLYLEAKREQETGYYNPSIELLRKLHLEWLKTDLEYIEAQRINHAHYERVKRLKKRNSDIVANGSAAFLTLTFTDEVLENTSFETRRRYVARYLREISEHYVANVDYGKTTAREHYHAIIKRKDNVSIAWNYGFSCYKSIKATEQDCAKVSKYVAKLTNHAIKKTAGRVSLIYSRNTVH